MTQPRQHDTPAPDQNDPTGRSRPGSPTYRPEAPPANNHRPLSGVRSLREKPATDEDAEEEARRSNEPISDSPSGGAPA